MNNSVTVHINGVEAGSAGRGHVVRSDGADQGILLNAEIALFDLAPGLQAALEKEPGPKFMFALEFPDGSKLSGSSAFVKVVSQSQTTLIADRAGWS